MLGGLLLAGLPLAVLAQDAPSLRTLQARYDTLDGLRASFTQVTSSEFTDSAPEVEGTVLLSGNRYRVETPTQTVVTDGATTWIYSPADSQVVVNDAHAEASRVTPQAFLRSATDNYDVTEAQSTSRNGAAHVLISLAATGTSARFEKAQLWVRRADRIVTRLRATDRNGSTLDLRLRDIVVDPPLTEDDFSFSAPSGVEVVDLRPEATN